jgi:hypothetical protein
MSDGITRWVETMIRVRRGLDLDWIRGVDRNTHGVISGVMRYLN